MSRVYKQLQLNHKTPQIIQLKKKKMDKGLK